MPREMSMRPLSPKSAPSSSSAAAAGGGANPDQISAQSSSDIVSADHDYAVMEELDEENINWGRLCTRVCSIFLLVVIIILAAIGGIYQRLYYLAVVVAVALVIIFGCSFLDLELLKSRTVHVFRSVVPLRLQGRSYDSSASYV